MELIRAYKFRIYPDAKRQSEIESQLILSREFYNLLLEKSIKSDKDGNKRLSMALLNSFAKEIEKDKKFLRCVFLSIYLYILICGSLSSHL